VPAHTFLATCSAVVNVGAKPVLVDVGKDFNIDCDKVEEVLKSAIRNQSNHSRAFERIHGRYGSDHGDR